MPILVVPKIGWTIAEHEGPDGGLVIPAKQVWIRALTVKLKHFR